MPPEPLTSTQRVLTALSHQEPDRVPVILSLTMHGAAELGLGLREYLTDTPSVIEGQLRLYAEYGHDCLTGFTHASREQEAFGGESLFVDDGPPNAGAPVAGTHDEILALEVPSIVDNPPLRAMLDLIAGLQERAAGEVPVLGVVVAPTSLPVMLLGFERWLDVLHEDAEAADHLLGVTRAFALGWAQAQLKAGATALAYFDPLCAKDATADALYQARIAPVVRSTIPELGGPAAMHLASGRVGDRLDDIISAGAVACGFSCFDDVHQLAARAAGRISLIGNLNGIRMARWSPEEAHHAAASVIRVAAPGGGFILADNHGEIPYQVGEEVLHAVMEAARTVGRYPIQPSDDPGAQ